MGHCGTLGALPTILPSNKAPPSLPSNHDFLVFHCIWVCALREALPIKGSLLTKPFCYASTHKVKPKPNSNPTGWETPWILPYPHWYNIVHFGPKPSWFYVWVFPPIGFIPIGYCPYLYTHKPFHSYPMRDIVRFWTHSQHEPYRRCDR